MQILLLEPFFTGSHQQWAEGYQRHSTHDVRLLTMKGKHWKWRMYGGAVTLARLFLASDLRPDLILASDMLDLTTFLALTRSKSANIPTAVYFHENQLTYPWAASDSRAKQQQDYSFLNYISALTADDVYFNSAYHRQSFLANLPAFLKQFPDYNELENVAVIAAKSKVVPLGLELSKFDDFTIKNNNNLPLLLWNHRWEYDKNPDEFFNTLYELKAEGVKFELAILGESYDRQPLCFAEAKVKLAEEIVHFGYAESFEQYAQWLWKADILPVTSQQDFFGGSVVEAMYCGCFPILPKRLAYPEHIPKALHSTYFYKNTADLKEKLTQAIDNIAAVRATAAYRQKILGYDWQVLCPLYDEVFTSKIGFSK